ncbi:MAG: phosphoenolpyruvate--protein phosphotransferase, partial [Oscillospiraceae bacterium]
LKDEDFCAAIKNIIIKEKVNTEYAISKVTDSYLKIFATMEGTYVQSRASDVRDVAERLISVLSHNVEPVRTKSKEQLILMTEELIPSETIQLNKSNVVGFATMGGSLNSHTAILSKIMNIPGIIETKIILGDEYEGKFAIIDGFSGKVYIDPEQEILEIIIGKQKKISDRKAMLNSLKGKENVTIDGQKIKLCANIGNSLDIESVLENDANGIGLCRSESLYIENNTFPTEKQQFLEYKSILQNMGEKRVVIRTLDIGADKKVGYFDLPEEENPAMGYRAIRICLCQNDIFKTQLHALYRASAFGKLSIIFPMITSLEEILDIKKLINEVKNELNDEHIPFDDSVELGITIETPAAVMISDILAKEVDFFSIGTNDLTQYTLAIDRQNSTLGRFYLPHHKAILRMIKMTADNAHANGIRCGICGELGADTSLTQVFLAMGIDELSVPPMAVLDLRKIVRETNISTIKEKLLKAIY